MRVCSSLAINSFRRVATTGANACLKAAPFAHNAVFSRSISYEEPSYGVNTDAAISPHRIRVPVLREAAKVEIYRKHVSDEEEFSVNNLAQLYGATTDRIQAVIYLMRARENMKKALFKTEDGSIPPLWSKINNQRLVAEENGEELDVDAMADDNQLSVEEVKDIIVRMTQHTINAQNVETTEADMDETLEDWRASGVDIRFQEMGREYKMESTYSCTWI